VWLLRECFRQNEQEIQLNEHEVRVIRFSICTNVTWMEFGIQDLSMHESLSIVMNDKF